MLYTMRASEFVPFAFVFVDRSRLSPIRTSVPTFLHHQTRTPGSVTGLRKTCRPSTRPPLLFQHILRNHQAPPNLQAILNRCSKIPHRRHQLRSGYERLLMVHKFVQCASSSVLVGTLDWVQPVVLVTPLLACM
jgi:hypothetical protein